MSPDRVDPHTSPSRQDQEAIQRQLDQERHPHLKWMFGAALGVAMVVGGFIIAWLDGWRP